MTNTLNIENKSNSELETLKQELWKMVESESLDMDSYDEIERECEAQRCKNDFFGFNR